MTAEPARSIITKRLVLTRIARDDVDDLVTMLLNPALYQHIGGAPASEAQARARAERWLGGSPNPDVLWINYVVRRSNDGVLVGLAQATVAGGTCEVAYLVDPPAQRQGFASEMMTAFCTELRESIEPEELTAHIYPGHTASEGVARAIGLVPTAERVDGEQVWRAATA